MKNKNRQANSPKGQIWGILMQARVSPEENKVIIDANTPLRRRQIRVDTESVAFRCGE